MNDIGDTPRRLLLASRKLFADNGFDGTSVRQITTAARANLGAVTYHFGSKRELYHAVLETVFTDLAERTESAAAAPGTPEERLRGIVAAFFAFFRDAPDAPRLVIRELAGGAPPAPAGALMRRNLAAIQSVVSAGQHARVFGPVQPFLAAFSIISQAVWFAVVGRHLPALTGLALPAALPDVVEHHVADVMCAALRAEDSP